MPEEPIIIPGRAMSSRAHGARRYKRRIHDAAKPLFPAPLTSNNIRVQVDYFYTTRRIVDLDNLLKCILDGLKGAAYEDDSQVEEIWIRRYNVFEDRRLGVVRFGWISYIRRREDFVSIVISENQVR